MTGASGLVGGSLCAALAEAGYEVVRLVRRSVKGPGEVQWDPSGGAIDAAALEGIAGVVHLAGESIAEGRWTTDRKRRIRDSRVQGTTLLAEALSGLATKPPVWVSASAIGYYGSRGDEALDEQAAAGSGFLASVCRDWEAATAPAEQVGIRVVRARIGIVLSAEGGALAKMKLPFLLGAGGRIGDGRQYMS